MVFTELFFVFVFLAVVLIAFEKLTGLPDKIKNKGCVVLYRICTLASVGFGWIIFRSETPGSILRYLKAMLGIETAWHDERAVLYLKENIVFWVAAVLLSMPVMKCGEFAESCASLQICF